MRVVLKGIVTRDDAELAVAHGVDGLIVSNHGGRSEDSGRGAIECLPEVVAGAAGRIPVLVDSGFRRGTDVFKALALGASAVCIGRPYVWGLAGLRRGRRRPGRSSCSTRELELVMRQAGTRDAEGHRRILGHRPRPLVVRADTESLRSSLPLAVAGDRCCLPPFPAPRSLTCRQHSGCARGGRCFLRRWPRWSCRPSRRRSSPGSPKSPSPPACRTPPPWPLRRTGACSSASRAGSFASSRTTSSCRRRSCRSPSTRRASGDCWAWPSTRTSPTNQFVYVYYTATSPTIHNRVSRFTANGNVAVAGSEFVLLDLPTLSATNHNGGAMHFGLDGKLYIAVGDNAVGSNSQTLANPLGKMLRVNTDGTIPTDNPFFTQTTGHQPRDLGARACATRSRSPSSRRRAGCSSTTSGRTRGKRSTRAPPAPTTAGPRQKARRPIRAFVTPVYCVHATAAARFRAARSPAARSTRACPRSSRPSTWATTSSPTTAPAGSISSTTPAASSSTRSPLASRLPSTWRSDPRAASTTSRAESSGVVVRINFTGSQAPAITQHPANRTVSVGQSASFTVAASGAPPLSYQWQRSGAPISGATSATYVLPTTTLSDNGAQFRAVVTNASGTATSNAATLTVVANQPPVPTIITPASGALYSAGTTLAYSGSATDPEDGAVPAQRFTWRIDFHHDAHTHPFVAPVSGSTSGSAQIPAVGHTETTVWYRVHLTVSDSAGLTATTFRDVQPRKVNLTLAANPSGAALTLDGQPVTAPFTFTSVVGVQRIIGATSPVTVGNKTSRLHVVVRRRRADAHHHDAGDEPDHHGYLQETERARVGRPVLNRRESATRARGCCGSRATVAARSRGLRAPDGRHR